MENDHKKDLRLILDTLYAVKYGAMQRWLQESESEKNEIYKDAVKEADNAIDAALDLYQSSEVKINNFPNYHYMQPSPTINFKDIMSNIGDGSLSDADREPSVLENEIQFNSEEDKKIFRDALEADRRRSIDRILKKSTMKED